MGQINEQLVAAWRLLALHTVEKRGKPKIVVLRPALERMVVALGTLQASAEEKLRNRLNRVLGIGRGAVKIRRGMVERAAAGRKQLPGELIIGHVRFQRPLQP